MLYTLFTFSIDWDWQKVLLLDATVDNFHKLRLLILRKPIALTLYKNEFPGVNANPQQKNASLVREMQVRGDKYQFGGEK